VAANSIGNASLHLSTTGGQLSQGLQQATSEVNTFAKSATSKLSSIGGALSKAKGFTDKAQSAVVGAVGKAGGWLSNAKGLLSGAGTVIGTFLGGPIGAAIGGAIGGALGSVGETVFGAISAPFEKLKELAATQKQADVLGVSASQLQGLSLQLGRVGIEGEQVGQTFAVMGKNVADAAGGHGRAAPALAQLGINAKQLLALPIDEQFKAIADAVSKLPPGAEQASAALHIFGGQGAALLPILQRGGKGVQDFIELQKKSGAVLSDSQFKAAADAQKAWKESRAQISAVWDGLVNRATLVAAPIIKFIGGAVSKAFTLLTPVFEWLGRAVERVSVILEQVAEVMSGWVDEAIVEIKSLVGSVQDFTGEWPTVEDVATMALRGVGVGLAYVWDTLKAGVGAGSYVIGYLVKGFGSLVDAFKGTVKDLLEIAGQLPDALGGDWFRNQAKNVDKLGGNIKAAGESLSNWGKTQINNFGTSASAVEKWFDKLKLKRDDVAKKPAVVPLVKDATPPEYKALAAVLKDSKEAFSIETKFKYDSKFAKDKKPEEKNNDELKKVNQKLDKVIQIWGLSIPLMAG
jgi:hypothetical protein